MKKQKHELIRIKNLIECDRLNAGDDFDELLKSDLKKLLLDYFDFDNIPNVSIQKEGDVFVVEIKLTALRIKTFGVIPK